MKRFILITVMMFASMALFSQIRTDGIIKYGIDRQEMMYKSYPKVATPFYNGDVVRGISKQRPASDTLWLPATMTYIGNSGNPSSRYFYEYHGNGLIKKLSVYSLYTGDIEFIADFNNTYRDPLMDIPDTVFYAGYIHPNTGEYYPPSRLYYNNKQADSSYWERYDQVWENDTWKTYQKTYAHYLNIAPSVSEFQDHVEIFDKDGRLIEGWKAFLTLDEQDRVVEALVEVYNTATSQYKVAGKCVYLYDEEGKCHTRNYYSFTYPDTWRLEHKLTDMTWVEFHGFDNGDMLYFGMPTGIYEGYSPKNKNKLYSLKFHELEGNTMALHFIDTIEWVNEPFSYNYFHRWNTGCMATDPYYKCNEYYHVVGHGYHAYPWDVAPCETNNESPHYLIFDFINKYDERGRRYEYVENQTVHLSSFPPDFIDYVTLVYTVDSFTYVINTVNDTPLALDKHALLIVPNPTNETARITATDAIETITLYALDGRLAYSQNGAGKEVTINVQGLAKGIYLVKALLKDGRQQTGKIVVN